MSRTCCSLVVWAAGRKSRSASPWAQAAAESSGNSWSKASVLACVSGAAGLLVALWGVSLLSAASAAALPRAQNIGLAWPVAVFALGLSVLTGLVFGLVPAVQAMRSNVRQSLNEEGRSGLGGVQHRKMRATLVVVEVGLALVLLVALVCCCAASRRSHGCHRGSTRKTSSS